MKLVFSPALYINSSIYLREDLHESLVKPTTCTMSGPKSTVHRELAEMHQAFKAYIFIPAIKLHWAQKFCAGCSQTLMERDRNIVSTVFLGEIPATSVTFSINLQLVIFFLELTVVPLLIFLGNSFFCCFFSVCYYSIKYVKQCLNILIQWYRQLYEISVEDRSFFEAFGKDTFF